MTQVRTASLLADLAHALGSGPGRGGAGPPRAGHPPPARAVRPLRRRERRGRGRAPAPVRAAAARVRARRRLRPRRRRCSRRSSTARQARSGSSLAAGRRTSRCRSSRWTRSPASSSSSATAMRTASRISSCSRWSPRCSAPPRVPRTHGEERRVTQELRDAIVIPDALPERALARAREPPRAHRQRAPRARPRGARQRAGAERARHRLPAVRPPHEAGQWPARRHPPRAGRCRFTARASISPRSFSAPSTTTGRCSSAAASASTCRSATGRCGWTATPSGSRRWSATCSPTRPSSRTPVGGPRSPSRARRRGPQSCASATTGRDRAGRPLPALRAVRPGRRDVRSEPRRARARARAREGAGRPPWRHHRCAQQQRRGPRHRARRHPSRSCRRRWSRPMTWPRRCAPGRAAHAAVLRCTPIGGPPRLALAPPRPRRQTQGTEDHLHVVRSVVVHEARSREDRRRRRHVPADARQRRSGFVTVIS